MPYTAHQLGIYAFKHIYGVSVCMCECQRVSYFGIQNKTPLNTDYTTLHTPMLHVDYMYMLKCVCKF